MNSFFKRFFVTIASLSVALLSLFTSFSTAYAHEVYVLSPDEIAQAVSMPSPNPFSALSSQEMLFAQYTILAIIIVLIVWSFSISVLFEKVFDPILMRLKRFAPLAGRLTLGTSLFASGYFHAFFGPELPMAKVLPISLENGLAVLLMIIGVFVLLGLYTRIVALIGIIIFSYTIVTYHLYMLTYVNYLGEMILTLIIGGGLFSLDRAWNILPSLEKNLRGILKQIEPYSFLILRILFGTALIFASFYAKFLHSNLALDTIQDYNLTAYFHFTPLFLVLGAFIVEASLGICFLIGFEVRFAALVFTFFLTLSILFFGEQVWPHIILFGVNITLFLHGYDKYTVEMAFLRRFRHSSLQKKKEPVL